MRNTVIKTILVFLMFAMFVATAVSQNLYVKSTDGTQDSYALNTISKLSFSSGNAIVHKTDNSTVEHALSEIRYMSFKDFTGIYQSQKQGDLLIIYPNPVNNLLNIILPSDKLGGELLVIGVDGKTLISRKLVNSQTSIDLSNLPKGIYLCSYLHGTHYETVKIIKQN